MAVEQQSVMQRMFARKTIAQVQRESANSELKRSLGKWNLLLLGVGQQVGIELGERISLTIGKRDFLGSLGGDDGFAPYERSDWLPRGKGGWSTARSSATGGPPPGVPPPG